MPNYCWNTIYIVGHKEDLDLFEREQLCFSYFKATPLCSDPTLWQEEHWGTKWDHWDTFIKRLGDNDIEFRFTTAWNPPLAFLRSLLVQYQRCWIRLRYYTEGDTEGIWIAYYKDGLCEKCMDWFLPPPSLTTSGEILLE